MANRDRPAGFEPYGPVDPNKIMVLEAGSAVYPGDFVRAASDGQVDAVAAGETIMGLCLDYGAAAGDKVRVIVDPDQLYQAQGDETEFDVQSDVFNVCDIVATAGNSTYKLSRQELDSSNLNTTSGQMVVLGLAPVVDNAFGAQAKILCKINEHQLVDAFAGV